MFDIFGFQMGPDNTLVFDMSRAQNWNGNDLSFPKMWKVDTFQKWFNHELYCTES